jgi:hypothetical protein
MNSLVIGGIRLRSENISTSGCKKSVEMFFITHDACNERHESRRGGCPRASPPSLDEYASKSLLQWTHPFVMGPIVSPAMQIQTRKTCARMQQRGEIEIAASSGKVRSTTLEAFTFSKAAFAIAFLTATNQAHQLEPLQNWQRFVFVRRVGVYFCLCRRRHFCNRSTMASITSPAIAYPR